MEKSDEDPNLEQIFKDVIDGKPISLDISQLNNILTKNLSINLNCLGNAIKTILPYMLVHFIQSWPGWKKTVQFQTKQISLETWFNKFKEYLVFKINYVIKHDYQKAISILKNDNDGSKDGNVITKSDCGTQTINELKDIAPFTLNIQGSAIALNSLVFHEGSDDSILVKEHRSSNWESNLNTMQLINWPYTKVEFKTTHLEFTRKNEHEYTRWLALNSEQLPRDQSDDVIEMIDLIDDNLHEREVYALDALKQWCNGYIHFLRKHLKLGEDQQKDVEIILENFILDVIDISKYSMATNTTVLFKIGNSVYAKNKRARKETIFFNESIEPKVNLSLIHFTGVQDGELTSFDCIDNLSHFTPYLTYSCTFCNVSFSKSMYLWLHFKTNHVPEQSVMCFKCKSQFKVEKLTENRWFHECKENQSK